MSAEAIWPPDGLGRPPHRVIDDLASAGRGMLPQVLRDATFPRRERYLLLVIPFLALFLTAAAAWVLRRRHEGVLWGSTTLGFGLAWLSVIALRLEAPLRLHLSVWQPVSLFNSDLVLQLDVVGWMVAAGVATLLLAISLLSPEIAPESGAFPRALLAVYGALGMAATLSGNLLTVVLTWALADAGAFIFSLALEHDTRSVSRHLNRLAAQGASIVLVLAATVPIGAAASLVSAPIAGVWGTALLGGAAFVRLIPVGVRREESGAGAGSLFGMATRFVPAGMGLAMLARQLAAGAGAEGAGAFAWLAVVAFIFACVAWELTGGLGRSPGILVVAVGSLGLIVAGVGGEGAAKGVAAAGAVALLAGGLSALAAPHESWHRIWPFLTGAVVLGLPGTVGHEAFVSLAAGSHRISLVAIVALVVAGLGLLGAGFFDLRGYVFSGWRGGEDLVKSSYVAGLVMLAVAPIVIALGGGYSFTLGGLAIFAAALAAAGVLRYADLRFGLPSWTGWEGVATSWASRLAGARVVASAPVSGLQSLGSMLEGEASILWVLVILVVLGLTLGAS